MTMNKRPAAGYRQESLRSHNASLIAGVVTSSSRPITRAEIVSETGLNRSTVSRVIDQLVEQGIVTELGTNVPSGGRPAVLVSPAPRTHVAIGAEITRNFVCARGVDLTGQSLVEVLKHPASEDAHHTTRILGDCLETLTGQIKAAGMNLVGIRCGISGLFSADQKRLLSAPTDGWVNVDLANVLDAAGGSGLMRFCNSTTLAAEAEAQARRTDPDFKDFIYLGGINGIGAALVRDWKVETGRRGWAGEIGHIPIIENGKQCTCGSRGCLQTLASPTAIAQTAGFAEGTPLAQLLAGLRRGEPNSRRALISAAHHLGRALSTYINLVDVPAVVLGGSFRPLYPHLKPLLEKELAEQCLIDRIDSTMIAQATLGDSAAPTGGALLTLREFVSDPTRWTTPQGGWRKDLHRGEFPETVISEW
ncbi:ROK family transcriptional regulator [Corynebacterium sp. CCM 8862]|uniref:ROK family transcriptional regulator n=2 Tax=Corynebacterium mendelii TaxID=2765362 RepID=A0A939IYN0_9CORY|nr:ROK family transcriptional regulator [Corynebacterium mendelii]